MIQIFKTLAAFAILIVLYLLFGYQTKEKKKYEFDGR
jgi:hypothetical protein